MKVKSITIYEAVRILAEKANVKLPKYVYERINDAANVNILQNAYLADKKKRPLCQDSGQVIVFIDIGQNVSIEGEFLSKVINKAVEDSYRENFYRKSVVRDAIFDRVNTQTNTPVIIHHNIVEGDGISLLLAVKGGGSENAAGFKVFNPNAGLEEITGFITELSNSLSGNVCPPFTVGVGIGGTNEAACLNSKRALFMENPTKSDFERNIMAQIPEAFDVNVISTSTHIASLPVFVSFNCHSARHASCSIFDGKIVFKSEPYDIKPSPCTENLKSVSTNDIAGIKSLKKGEKVFLNGEIYTARDTAHHRLVKMLDSGETLPINLKDKILFYAGPAPKKDGEIIGPTGPTTAKRMGIYAKRLFEAGVLASIGKGELSSNDKPLEGIYFKMQGGVACLIQDCIKSYEVVAFDDLGTEAIAKMTVSNLPVERA